MAIEIFLIEIVLQENTTTAAAGDTTTSKPTHTTGSSRTTISEPTLPYESTRNFIGTTLTAPSQNQTTSVAMRRLASDYILFWIYVFAVTN